MKKEIKALYDVKIIERKQSYRPSDYIEPYTYEPNVLFSLFKSLIFGAIGGLLTYIILSGIFNA